MPKKSLKQFLLSDEHRLWLFGGVLGVVSVLAYLPSAWGGFVWDDLNNLGHNTRLCEWQNILDVFVNPAMWSAEKGPGLVGTYRPLSLSLFVLDFKVWGGAPWGYHVTNIFLHLLCVITLFNLFFLMTGRSDHAFLMALIFAVHPVGVEAIAWINGRSEPIALIFGANALCLLLRKNTGKIVDALALSVLLLLSVLGKESGVVFFFLAGFLVVIKAKKLGAARVAVFGCALLLALAAYFFLRQNALGAGVAPPIGKIATILPFALGPLWFKGLQTAVLPVDRAIVMVASWAKANTSFENILYMCLSVVIVVLAAYTLFKRQWNLSIGIFWFLIGLLPASMLIILGWPGFSRWMYIALPGLLIAFRELLVILGKRVQWPHGKGVIVAIASAYLFLLELAIPVWGDNVELYKRTIIENPGDSYGYTSLGIVLFTQGQYLEIEKLFRKSLAIDPSDAVASMGLAMELSRRGRCHEARLIYESHMQVVDPPREFRRLFASCTEGVEQAVRE
ncbi:MAG: hypothetical protein MUC50_13365 [Myxococcota bacterium]|jgi:hypothetical protein|nr:hypothetical protein [Myxococcota bacterium]